MLGIQKHPTKQQNNTTPWHCLPKRKICHSGHHWPCKELDFLRSNRSSWGHQMQKRIQPSPATKSALTHLCVCPMCQDDRHVVCIRVIQQKRILFARKLLTISKVSIFFLRILHGFRCLRATHVIITIHIWGVTPCTKKRRRHYALLPASLLPDQST